MNNPTISIFGNKILLEIINEINLFSKFNIKHYDSLDLCIKDANFNSSLVILFVNDKNQQECEKIKEVNFPIILITKLIKLKNTLLNHHVEQLNVPFKIQDLNKKIISLVAKHEFKKSSLISLGGYIIDRNERKIKKNNLELQLTEKEIDFLVLFSKTSNPISRNTFLKSVWNYSSESDTHTVETHIHRLRKKFLEKFNDKYFIKNNDKGYYI